MSTPIPIPANIAKLTGPILLGHFFNWGLFGVLGVQTYVYYLAFPKDTKVTKSIVAVVVLIEVLQTILSTRDAFRNFGLKFGDMADLDDIGWLWFSVPVLGALISLIAQIFFAWRIWILSRSLILPIFISILSLTQCVAGIWVGTWSHLIGHFSKMASHTYPVTCVWLGGTAFCDVIIAIAMIYYLTTSRSGFRATNIIITKIIRVTVETGLICAAFAILDLAFFLAFRDNNYHLAPSIALSKLYSNSLLVVLNSRVRIVGGRMLGTTIPDTIVTHSGSTTGGGLAFASVGTKADTLNGTMHGRINVDVSRDLEMNTTPGSDSTKTYHSETEFDRKTAGFP